MTTQEIADFRGKLRAEIKNTRKGLSLEDWARRSGRVFNQLISFELFHKATSIHCYLSSELQREVDTRPILSWMLDAGKTVYVPAIKGREIFSVRYHKETATVEGKFGVRQPDASMVADETKIDLVLVPLLVADKSGNRLGYGKGYYDRFFTRLAHEKILPIKVGLAFDFQLVETIPVLKTDSHVDVPLDAIATEIKIITI